MKLGAILGMAAGATCVALPLWLAQAVQDAPGGQRAPREGARDRGGRDDERVDAGPALAQFTGATTPATLAIVDGARERSDPLLVARPGGGAWLLCLEHELVTGDRLALRELLPDGTLARPEAAPTLLPAPPAPPRAIVRPVAVADESGQLVVAWTEPIAGVAQLQLAVGGAGGFGPIVALTAGATPNRNPELARAADGTLWIAWERWTARAVGSAAASERGSFDVVAAPLRDGRLGDVIVVGDGIGSDLDPVVAANGAVLAVAWCSYRGRDYEIALRQLDPASGALGPPMEVSAEAAADDLHPTLVAAADGAWWLAWDRFEDESRGSSLPAELAADAPGSSGATRRTPARATVRVACVRDGAVTLPTARGLDGSASEAGLAAGAPLLSFSGALPKLLARPDGSLALLWRFLARQGPGGKAYGWPLLISAIDGRGIGAPVMVAESAGGAEEVACCIGGDGALLAAWQQDQRLSVETGTLLRPLAGEAVQRAAKAGVVVVGSLGPSAIGVGRCELAVAAAPAAAAVAPLARPDRRSPPHAHPAAADLDDPIVNGDDHVVYAANGKEYRLYWGDLHRHSSVSRCSRGFEPGPADRYAFGRDSALHDFMALTDHSCHVDPFGWWRLDKAAEVAGDPGFVALCGFEWSTGFHGHQNILLRGTLRPFLSNSFQGCSTLPGLYSMLKPEWALAIPHHTADVARRTDFAQCDPRFVTLVEIYQAQRGSYEFDGCLRQSHLAHAAGSFAVDALLQGRKVGFVASTDHGEGAAYAAVIAEKLERGALFDALRARRTFGATAKGMVIDLRVDDHLMGEELIARAAPQVTVKARGTRELVELIVFRDGAPWQVVGRASPLTAAAGGDARSAPVNTELTAQFELVPPKTARASDWRVTIRPQAAQADPADPAAAATAVTMKPWFELPGYARDDLGPDRPQWRVKDGVATWLWKKGYANFWEPSHSRLRLTGPRGAVLVIEARALATSAANQEGGEATLLVRREVTLAELGAPTDPATASGVGGDSPLGPWRLTARESFDASVDLARTLGTRELAQEWRDDALPLGDHWYYARIVQADGEIAWSSPLFVTRR